MPDAASAPSNQTKPALAPLVPTTAVAKADKADKQEKVAAHKPAERKDAKLAKSTKPEGFKLYAIRPTSAFAKLGLTNGDTLTSINGFELNSADRALEVYTKLREATSLELEVTRRGKPVTLKYTIR